MNKKNMETLAYLDKCKCIIEIQERTGLLFFQILDILNESGLTAREYLQMILNN